MTSFYFDIETVSKDPECKKYSIKDPSKCKIITIQYQRFDCKSGKECDDLIILREWRIGEKAILKKFKNMFLGGESNKFWNDEWSFTPFGTNLYYEFWFLQQKFHEYFDLDFSIKRMQEKPKFDLKPLLIAANKGQFSGASLDNFSSKAHGGGKIHEWYYDKEYEEITKYIQKEAEAFLEVYSKVVKRLPSIL